MSLQRQRGISTGDVRVTSPSLFRSSAYFSAPTVRKRYFHETSSLSLDNETPTAEPSTSQTNNKHSFQDHRRQDVALDKFTHFALNSHMIPLGSMQDENWIDILDAIDAWLNIGGGFAADSAERLLDRLLNEHAASFSKRKSNVNSSYSHRSMMLADLQRGVLTAWIDAFHHSEGTSKLAILRGEQALYRLVDILAIADKSTIHSRFPIEEYISVVESYLQHNEDEDFEKAALLLLRLAPNSNEKWNLSREMYSTILGPAYEKCAAQLLAIDSKTTLVTELLESMTGLKESGLCPDLNIPDGTERILLDATAQRARNPQKSKPNVMTPFEIEAAQSRLLTLLQKQSLNDRNTIHGLLQRLSSVKLRNNVTAALVEYYINIGDCEYASHWLQKLESQSLVSPDEYIERVMKMWLSKKGPRIPWRADEVFKTITNKAQKDRNQMLSPKCFDIMIAIWKASDDPSASRKIIDWYTQMKTLMIAPCISTLKVTVEALPTGSVDNTLELVSSDVLKHWDNFTQKDKVEIANALLGVISLKKDTSDSILSLIHRFRADDLVHDKAMMEVLLAAVPIDGPVSEVSTIVHSFENKIDETQLSIYTAAIDKLLKMKDDAKAEIRSLYDDAMKQIVTNRNAIDANDLSEFLYSIIAMHVNRKSYSEAEMCLKKAEDSLLSKINVTNDHHSPIPLKCYKKIIVRNWYTEKTAQKVEESFEKLINLYHRGYRNLQPDSELCTAYIEARVVRKKDVEHNLEAMIESYQLSDNKELKPEAKAFNAVLLSLASDKRNAKQLSDKSVNLLNTMSALDVQPDIKTLNLVLKNAIKGKNKNVYELSTMLMEMMETNNLIPDTHTLHSIIDACGSAPSDDREGALKRCLTTFGEIRKQDIVGPITYGILSKVIFRLTSKGARADKVGESLLSMCCDDGLLTSEVKGRLESMMSHSAWEKHYVSRLSTDGRDPADWNRNVQTK